MTLDAAAPQPRRPSLGEVLTGLARDWDGPRISVAQLMEALGDRGLVGLMLILAFVNVIPNPPGTSAVLGLPMLYLSWQMMRGGLPWLPQMLGRRSLDIVHFRTVVARAVPYLNRVERLLRPRVPALSSPAAVRMWGAVCLLLSVVLVLPIPLGNLFPAAAILIIALGLLERDGIWILCGAAFGLVTTVAMAGAIAVVTRGLLGLLTG